MDIVVDETMELLDMVVGVANVEDVELMAEDSEAVEALPLVVDIGAVDIGIVPFPLRDELGIPTGPVAVVLAILATAVLADE